MTAVDGRLPGGDQDLTDWASHRRLTRWMYRGGRASGRVQFHARMTVQVTPTPRRLERRACGQRAEFNSQRSVGMCQGRLRRYHHGGIGLAPPPEMRVVLHTDFERRHAGCPPRLVGAAWVASQLEPVVERIRSGARRRRVPAKDAGHPDPRDRDMLGIENRPLECKASSSATGARDRRRPEGYLEPTPPGPESCAEQRSDQGR